MTTVYESPTALSAIIPASQLASGTALTLEVINPAPGGASATTQTFTFTPTIDEAVNSASFLPGGAPGEIISLFGANIGPTTPVSFTAAANYISNSLGGVSVKVDNVAAPIVYVSQHQINVRIPYEVALGPGMTIVVTNGANPSANGTINISATSPGIFASPDSTGVLWASALNTSKTTGVVSVNSSTNAAHVGDTITLYVTGKRTYSNTPAPVDGYVIPPGYPSHGPRDADAECSSHGHYCRCKCAGHIQRTLPEACWECSSWTLQFPRIQLARKEFRWWLRWGEMQHRPV